MVTFLGCLCLVLTLWMSGSQPSTTHRTGSPDSSFWNQDTFKFQSNGLARRKAGDLAGAEAIYFAGYQTARARNDKVAQTRYLISVAGCQLLASRFRDALSNFLQARELAESAHDWVDAGAIEVNLSSLYLQMWDIPAAQQAAQNGLQLGTRAPHSYWLGPLYIQQGRLLALLEDPRAESFFLRGIDAARAERNLTYEAIGWDLLGEGQLASGALADAEYSLGQAFRIRWLQRPSELGLSWGLLGALKTAQGDLPSAALLTERAIDALSKGQVAWPKHLLFSQRAKIRILQKQFSLALPDFSLAIEATAQWRLEAPPSRSVLVNIDDGLQKRVFDSMAAAAAEHGWSTDDPEWAAQALAATEINRAASLRYSVALSSVWRSKLPALYWETAAHLSAAESGGTGSAKNSTNLHLKLSEMESLIDVNIPRNKTENFSKHGSLIHIQGRLRGSELFLSFKLGKNESYLWAVSGDTLRLYKLAGERQIADEVGAFREALLAGSGKANQQAVGSAAVGSNEVIRRGQKLYQTLFGQLGHEERSKTAWLLSVEGALFGVPFAALVAEHKGGNTVYLVDQHSVQIVPGAWLLSLPTATQGTSQAGGFLGVADPIYNQADPRWRVSQTGSLTAFGELQRLPGSAREVRASAEAWRSSSGSSFNNVELLLGPDARRFALFSSLQKKPSVVHLATHVVSLTSTHDGSARGNRNPPPDNSTLIALGLAARQDSRSLRPDYLTSTDIAGLDVSGALVVMTGCATAAGEVHAGAGLLGLTHAWLAAGAGAVVATQWPVEDTTGEMFVRFYGYLQKNGAAEALRRTQIEMAHAGDRQSGPTYWASFQITGVKH